LLDDDAKEDFFSLGRLGAPAMVGPLADRPASSSSPDHRALTAAIRKEEHVGVAAIILAVIFKLRIGSVACREKNAPSVSAAAEAGS
jgi:hypothetical protein